MKKLEHIGIAVRNLDKSNTLFAKLLGSEPYKTEMVRAEGVRTSFFDVAGVKFELSEPTRADSPVAKFIEKRGEGIHHLAFEVDDMDTAIKEYIEKDFHFINDGPRDGADNKVTCYLHPKATHGVLVELCQEKKG